jgi:hypothetical protein
MLAMVLSSHDGDGDGTAEETGSWHDVTGESCWLLR